MCNQGYANCSFFLPMTKQSSLRARPWLSPSAFWVFYPSRRKGEVSSVDHPSNVLFILQRKESAINLGAAPLVKEGEHPEGFPASPGVICPGDVPDVSWGTWSGSCSPEMVLTGGGWRWFVPNNNLPLPYMRRDGWTNGLSTSWTGLHASVC